MKREASLELALQSYMATRDPEALRVIFDATASGLLRTAVRLTRDRNAGEDLVQATFLVVIERRIEFASDGRVEPWLRGILLNRVRQWRKRNGRHFDPSRVHRAEPPDPSCDAVASEVVSEVREAVRGLPARYREVVELHVDAGMPPAEIARSLDRRGGTVRMQLKRGLEWLRGRLPAGLGSGGVVLFPELAALRGRIMDEAARTVEAQESRRGGLGGYRPFLGLTAAVCVLSGAAVWLSSAISTVLRGSPSSAPGLAEPSERRHDVRGDVVPGTREGTQAALAHLAGMREEIQPTWNGEVVSGSVVLPLDVAEDEVGSPLWIPGVSSRVHQQTIYAERHLKALQGRRIVCLSWQRSVSDEACSGGAAFMSITLSTSRTRSRSVSPRFDENVGVDAVRVYAGEVTVPASPPVQRAQLCWSPENRVRVLFDESFRYVGGDLCVDVFGAPIDPPSNWSATSVFQDVRGTLEKVGDGCSKFEVPYPGGHGNPASRTSSRDLVIGGTYGFRARGTPWGTALLVCGDRSELNAVDLFRLGYSNPGCYLHIPPDAIVSASVTRFVPLEDPRFLPAGGMAWIPFNIPYDTRLLGSGMVCQWVDVDSGFTVLEGFRWTVASALPTLGATLVQGGIDDESGVVYVFQAHLMRFEYTE